MVLDESQHIITPRTCPIGAKEGGWSRLLCIQKQLMSVSVIRSANMPILEDLRAAAPCRARYVECGDSAELRLKRLASM